MKVKAYMRVARHGRTRVTKLEANVKPSARPLKDAAGEPLPTVAFAVELDIPDAMFRQAEQVIATLAIPEAQAQIAADVVMAGSETRC